MKSRVSPYIVLAKPRILALVSFTAGVGFFMGGKGIVSWSLLFYTILGTALTCAGSAALNNYLERDCDKFMKRTCRRPLPSGQISPSDALTFGIVMVLLGTCLLVSKVNLISGFLALLTAFLYVLVYTPLKRVTWLNTFIGAIPGALPPMGGWAAATGEVGLGAWILFFIMFFWQHPHFYAIAWMYREDYARGGFKMLPVVEPDGRSTFRQIIIYSVLLIAIAALPTLTGMSGFVYFWGAALMGVGMLAMGILLYKSKSVIHARRLLQASILYLPVIFALIITDTRF